MVGCLTPQGSERTKGPLHSERSDFARDLGNTKGPNCQNSELVKCARYIFDCSQQRGASEVMRSGAVLFGWCEFLTEYIECDIFINDKRKETIKLLSSAPP